MKEQQTHNNINPPTKTPKRVPKLRFKEFSDNYSNYEFSEIVNKRNKSYNPNNDKNNYTCIELESLSQETGLLLSTFNTADLKSNKTFFKENDVLFGKLRPYLKKYWYADFDGVCTSEIWVLNGSKVINKYLFYLIQTEKFNYEANVSTGSKMPRADWDNVSSATYYVPKDEEQQKIATFLSSVDKKIDQLQQKQHLLEQYKKGVMQKIFSQKLRFKPALSAAEGDDDGNEYPDWEEKKLGEILDYEQPTNYLVSSTEYSDDYKTPVLTAGKTFILGYTDETDNIFKDELPVIIFDDFTTATQFVDFPFKAKSSAMKILKAKKSENIKFIYESMQNIQFEIGGHGRHWISKFSVMKIPYPCLEEQTKIAHFLSAIDAKIALVNTQIENTQQFKKGLLQQMFV